MGDSEVLLVMFHFNGVFVIDGTSVEYCNGDYGVSHIDKDKLSILELEGHLLDHTTFTRSVRMFWLPFGAALSTGLRMLANDKSCLDMLDVVGSDGDAGFEVRDKKWRFTVDLGQKTCSCRYWQLSGIPCRHACAALFTMSDEPNNYVNACFSIDQYKTTYQHVLQPVEHESAWPVSPNPKPLPPRVKKMPGRPQTKRRQDPSERVNSTTKSSRVGVKITCRRCKGTGHNSKTCSVPLQQNSTSGNNPSHSHGSSSAPLAIEQAASKGKGPAASSSTKSAKRKGIEGYGLYYGERTGTSYIQTGKKRKLVSFGTSNSIAKASAVGNASVVIETSAGHPTSSARATINGTGGRATAKIQSISFAKGCQKKAG